MVQEAVFSILKSGSPVIVESFLTEGIKNPSFFTLFQNKFTDYCGETI